MITVKKMDLSLPWHLFWLEKLRTIKQSNTHTESGCVTFPRKLRNVNLFTYCRPRNLAGGGGGVKAELSGKVGASEE